MTVDVNDMGSSLELQGQKNSTRDGEVRGAAWWGQMKAAPVACEVVSFLPTQTSRTRLIGFENKKSPPTSKGKRARDD